jgi:hypothetical protein
MLKGGYVPLTESSTTLHNRAYLYEGRDNISESSADDLGLRRLQCVGSEPRDETADGHGRVGEPEPVPVEMSCLVRPQDNAGA